MNRYDWQVATDGLSKFAKILALKWSGIATAELSKEEILKALALSAPEFMKQFEALVVELNDHGLKVPVTQTSTGRTYKREFSIPNELGIELRARVGAAYLEGAAWQNGEAIKLYTGYEDHQKVVDVIGKAGLPPPDRQRPNGTMEYRLSATDPVALPKKHAVPTGAKKKSLFSRDKDTCQICGDTFKHGDLSPDHRVPTSRKTSVDLTQQGWMAEYQSLCVSCNHQKREACKRCKNTHASVCERCFWANPSDYDHLAGKSLRVDRIAWAEDKMHLREKLQHAANAKGVSMEQLIEDWATTL